MSILTTSECQAVRLHLRGQVQGVGLRPFVYRLARQCRLAGQVCNAAAGVLIEVEGAAADLRRFQERLCAEKPAEVTLDTLRIEPAAPTGRTTFVITASESAGRAEVRVPRDLAVCADCRRDLVEPGNRRHGYPFTSCTACGPRYSIITALPYDRPATSMNRFTSCRECTVEYETPDDRRFHSQTNACAACGPEIGLLDHAGRVRAGPDRALAAAGMLLRQGRIVALKGLGGFQLLVRADEEEAVRRLRQRKQRPSKPFAVMVSTLAQAERHVRLGSVARALLQSPRNPIVVADRLATSVTAPSVAPRTGSLGLFLPTTPLHHLLLADLEFAVVASSGNRGDEPIETDERRALNSLAGIADAFLVHDRPIVRRLDDSVARESAGQMMMIRLARGYAPLPLPALEEFAAARRIPPILATGGHQKAALALWTGTQAVLTQHLGDMDGPGSRSALEETANDLQQLYRCTPAKLACDLHPDYFTTTWAQSHASPVVRVQHHHAHAVAGMVEHGLLDREVLAVTWDGTGYGPDGTIWGGEILHARCDGYERLASLLPFPLPGGEAAIRRPAHTAFGLLHQLLGEETLLRDDRYCRLLGVETRTARLLATMIRDGLRTPWTSSVGRLFDAVAALVLGAHVVSYEGEAAVWLEAVADANVTEAYEMPAVEGHRSLTSPARPVERADWKPVLAGILRDLERDVTPGVIAGRFHNTLARWAGDVAARQPTPDVVLSGGCFQNRLLAERTRDELLRRGKRVHLTARVPPGDGGLAVGQLAVASS